MQINQAMKRNTQNFQNGERQSFSGASYCIYEATC